MSHEKLGTENGEIDLETLRSILLESLQMMDSYLTDASREILCQKFLPSTNDIKMFKESKLKLLEYLWTVKEVTRKRPDDANLHEWMVTILTTIKRLDLLNIWIVKSNEILQKGMADSNRRPAAPSQPQHPKTEQNQNRGGKGTAHASESKTDSKAVNERLTRLEEMLERNVKLTERIASGSIGQNAFTTPYSYGQTKLGADADNDWSKLSQSKFFNKK